MKERIRIGKANKDRTIEKQKCFSQSFEATADNLCVLQETKAIHCRLYCRGLDNVSRDIAFSKL